MPQGQLSTTHATKVWTAGPLPLIALAIFVPGHMFNWALEWAWLAVQMLAGTAALLFSRNSLRETAGVPALVWVTVFTALTFTGCVSALHGYMNAFILQDAADVADLLRLLFFIPLALHVSTLIEPHHVRSMIRLLKACVLLNLVCSVLLVAEIHPFSDLVLLIYEGAKVQYAVHHIRIGIPFTNPNFAALLFTLMLAIFMFFSRSMLFTGLTIVAIVLTGSRSGYIAAAPLLLLGYVELIFRSTTNRKVAAIVVLGHVAVAWVASDLVEFFGGFSRMNELVTAMQGGNLGGVNTASIRFEVIDRALTYIEASPMLGVGPGRSLGLDVVDSQIVTWPLAYGIPAAALLYGIFLAPMIVLAMRARRPLHRLAALATGLSFFLMLGTGDFMKNYRLFYIVLVLMQTMHLIANRVSRTATQPPLSTPSFAAL